MTAQSEDDHPAGAGEVLDSLLEQVLARAETDGADAARDAVEQLCAAHAAHADTLRRRVALLSDLGVLAPVRATGHDASPPDGGGSRAGHGVAPARAAGDEATGPQRLGPFRLLRPLGAGGMGVVHLAEQVGLGRRVALKVIRPEQLFFPGARERFRREVETVARLQHPGIVPIYTVGEERGVPYFAMELVEGCSLADVVDELRRHGPGVAHLTGHDLAQAVARRATPAAEGAPRAAHADDAADAWLFAGTWEAACLRIVRLLAEALDHAHRRGVIHRDIKPSNVMITHGSAGGQVKLLDFGLASNAPGVTSLTRSGSRVGSLHYMAPEQARGDVARVDARTDVYALGVVLYELLTLSRPFAGESEAAVLAAIQRGGATPVRALHPGITWEAETVCLTALDADPSRRYATAADLARDLDNVARRRPLEARRAGPVLRARRWVERNPMAATSLLLGALLLVGVPLLFLVRERQTSAAIRDELARADAHFARSIDAIDRMLTRVGSVDLAYVPQMEPVRTALLEDAVELTEAALAAERDDPVARERAAASNARLGRLLLQLGRSDEGFAALHRSLALHDERIARAAGASVSSVPRDADAARARAERAGVLASLAEGLAHAGRVAEAEDAHRRADADLAAITGDPASVSEHRLRRAGNLAQLGGLLATRADPDDEASYAPALDAWRDALALCEQALAVAPDDAAVHAQAGEIRSAMAEQLLERAAPPFERERALLDAAVSDYARAAALAPSDPSLLLRGLVTRLVLSKTYKAEGRFDEAERIVSGVVAGLEDLAGRFPSTPAYGIELATALNELGNIFDWQRRAGDAATWYGRAVEQLAQLAARYPHLADVQSRAGQGELNLGVQHLALRDAARATGHIERAIAYQRRAVQLAPDHAAYPRLLRAHHMAHSDSLIAQRRFAEAADAADAVAAALPGDWESWTQAGSQMAKIVRHVALVAADADLDGALTDELARRAVAHLRRALELGFPHADELHSVPVLDPLRGRPQFDALLQELATP